MPNIRKPISPKQAYDGNYWSLRAERTRRLAGRPDKTHIRNHLEKIAQGYELLAQRAYKLQREIKGPDHRP